MPLTGIRNYAVRTVTVVTFFNPTLYKSVQLTVTTIICYLIVILMYRTLRRKCYLHYLYNFKETLFILFIELYEGDNNNYIETITNFISFMEL